MKCRTCDLSQSGEYNSFRPLTVGVCTDAYFGSYSLLTAASGVNNYLLNFGCSDATCLSCRVAVNMTTGVCASQRRGTTSYVLTTTRCQGALTNPTAAPANSITLLWRNNTLSCINATLADVITFGVVGASLNCLPFANGWYAGLMQNIDGTYSGGVYCESTCTSCQQTLSSLALNACLPNVTANSSTDIQPTSSLTTCYVAPPTTTTRPTTTTTVKPTAAASSSNGGAIAGGILGALVGIVIIAVAVNYYLKHAKKSKSVGFTNFSNTPHEDGGALGESDGSDLVNPSDKHVDDGL